MNEIRILDAGKDGLKFLCLSQMHTCMQLKIIEAADVL